MIKSNTIMSLLNIRPEEKLIVFLLLAYSFFIGIGLYMYYTAATTLFLTKFDSIMLPIAYIAGGFFVHIIGRSNSYIQKYIKFSSLSISLVISLIISLSILLISYDIYQSKWAVFLLFLWIRVNLFVFGFTFWLSASRMFDLGQAKRLFSLIGMGEVLASIVANFLVKILISQKIIKVEGLLSLSLCFIIISLFFIIIIINKNKEKLSFKRVVEKDIVKTENSVKNRYHIFMYLLGILPIACLYLIEFDFSISSKVIFPEKEQLAAFLGQYILICSTIELLVKGILFSFITKTYGIMSGLIVLPISLIVVSVAVLLMTVLNLKIFFLILLSRFLITSIRRSFSDTSYQLLYQPIPHKESILLQNQVETYAKPLGYVVAGVLLLSLSFFNTSSTIYVFSVLLVILIIWSIISFKMKSTYKDTLLSILSASINLKEPVLTIIKDKENEVTNDRLPIIPFDLAIKLVESPTSNNRVNAAYYLSKSGRYFAFKYIIKLLEDRNEEVRLAAIEAASDIKSAELLPYLFSNIVSGNLKKETMESLLKIGDPVIDYSSNYFNKYNNKKNILVSIIEIVENIGGPKGIRFLRSKLNYPLAEINDRVVEALNKLSYKANLAEESFIISEIDAKISLYIWLLASENDLKDSRDMSSLVDALKKERKSILYKLINLLTLLYGDQRFQEIKNLFYNPKSQAKSYLSDLIGFLLSEEMKLKILPLFENVSDFEILLKNQQKYPQQNLTYENRILSIINKDKDSLSIWTKALAFKQLLQYSSENTMTAFAANTVAENGIISEIALFGLAKLNPIRFAEIRDHFSCINNEKYRQISSKTELYRNTQELLVSKAEALFYSTIFNTLEIQDIINISSSLSNISLNIGESVKQDFLDLSVSPYTGLIVSSGEILLTLQDNTESVLTAFNYSWFSNKIKTIRAAENSTIYLTAFTLMPENSSKKMQSVHE